jgi:hypothetical protein
MPGCRPRRLGCLSGGSLLFRVLIDDRLVGISGSPLPPHPRRFRREKRFLPATVPRSLAQTGSSSRSFAPLQSSLVPCLPRASRHRAPSMGLPALFATSTSSVVVAGIPGPPPSVLGVSHALDGLIRYRPCGFISPRSHVQGSLSRGFPSRTAEPPRRRPVPSRRLAMIRCRCCHRRHETTAPPTGL